MRFGSPLSRALLTAACVALSCGAGPSRAGESGEVSTTLKDVAGTFHVFGQFRVDASPQVAWEVLTDYHHIPKFVGALKDSRLVDNLGPYHILLHQEFEGGFLFFTKRVKVQLDVLEVPYRAIVFTDLERGDFQRYYGAWMIDPSPGGGLQVRYQLEAKQNFDAPFAGDFMNGGVKDLLNAVRREMTRRQAKADREVLPSPDDPPATAEGPRSGSGAAP